MTVADLDVFKDIVSLYEIDEQIRDTLQTWMQTYQNEVCRQLSIDPATLPAIRSWNHLEEFRRAPESQSPGIFIVSTGTGKPTKDGEGWWRTPILYGIAVITSARTMDESRKLAKLYAAAIRAIMIQKRAGGDKISDVSWLGETYDDIDQSRKDMLAAATGSFEVVAGGLVKGNGAGPLAPILTQPDPLPVVADDPGRIVMTGKE